MDLNSRKIAIHHPHSMMIQWIPVIYIRKVLILFSAICLAEILHRLVLTLLRTNENSWPFLEPVTEELAPNYFTIIEVD